MTAVPNKGPNQGTPKGAPPQPQEYRIRSMDSATFAKASFPLAWLVEQILVLGQPAVIGGPKKTLKTSLAIDMAVSISTATPFLGHFPVLQARRVAVISGESGPAALRATARRVCAARGLHLEHCPIEWSVDLPSLGRESDLRELTRFLRAKAIEVAILDPLYLCLRGGDRAVSPSNLYEIGPLLWGVAQACLGSRCTPVLIHHAVKTAGRKSAESSEPLDLSDLAFSGIAEFARQWLLVSRRGEFDPASGQHRLLLSAGGSAGHSGLWDVEVREGVLQTDFNGRRWAVTVHPASAGADEYRSPAAPRNAPRGRGYGGR